MPRVCQQVMGGQGNCLVLAAQRFIVCKALQEPGEVVQRQQHAKNEDGQVADAVRGAPCAEAMKARAEVQDGGGFYGDGKGGQRQHVAPARAILVIEGEREQRREEECAGAVIRVAVAKECQRRDEDDGGEIEHGAALCHALGGQAQPAEAVKADAEQGGDGVQQRHGFTIERAGQPQAKAGELDGGGHQWLGGVGHILRLPADEDGTFQRPQGLEEAEDEPQRGEARPRRLRHGQGAGDDGKVCQQPVGAVGQRVVGVVEGAQRRAAAVEVVFGQIVFGEVAGRQIDVVKQHEEDLDDAGGVASETGNACQRKAGGDEQAAPVKQLSIKSGRGGAAQLRREVMVKRLPLAVSGVFARCRPVAPEGKAAAPRALLQPVGKRGVARGVDEFRRLVQGDARGKVTAAVFRVMAVVQLVLLTRPNGAARQMVAAGKVLAQGVKVVAAQVDVLQRRFVRLCLQDSE